MANWRATIRCCALAAAGIATAALLTPAANANPSPPPVPGGLTPTQAHAQQRAAAQAAATGTCISDGPGVCIVKATTGPSCTGYASQTTPPATIRVLVHTPSIEIVTVPFKAYVENVLPNEWVASWDGDALKAGAVAVKSYAWYWVTHFGGYLNGDPTQCFDVTDDADFQVYKAGSALSRTSAAVEKTWPVAARIGGKIVQTLYRAYLHSATEGCGAYADGSTMSQYGTQACNEANTGNKYNVILQTYYRGVQLATKQQQRTPHDFTFEQTSTRATFAAGRWVIDDGYPTTFSFGTTGDRPVSTDDGDGFALIGVFRPSNGTWYLGSPTGAIAVILRWGQKGDIPVPGHYAGIAGASVPAVYRPSNGTWYLKGRSTLPYGTTGDIPVPADYNGDGSTDIAVFRPSNGNWYVHGRSTVHFGTRGDVPAPADYNGDGKTDLAVYRPSTGIWYVKGVTTVAWGARGDIPVTGDFTGDGKADITMFRPANHTWYVRGHAHAVFGAPGVVPIGQAPYSQ